MDARDYIDEIMQNNIKIESLLDIFENLMVDLDCNTSKSNSKDIINLFLNRFKAIHDALARENEEINIKLDALWDIVVKLEK